MATRAVFPARIGPSTHRRGGDPVAGGFRYLIGDHLQLGAAYEVPLTDDDNTIIDHRIYFDVVVHF